MSSRPRVESDENAERDTDRHNMDAVDMIEGFTCNPLIHVKGV